MLTKTKGAILRSKVSWHEEGERNTKNFYSLEKCHRDIKTVSKLKVGENCYIEDQFEILQKEKKFYESLYRSTSIDPKNFKNSPFFNPENVTALSEEEKKSCEMGSRTSTIIKPWALMETEQTNLLALSSQKNLLTPLVSSFLTTKNVLTD